jgi:iron complex transport system substrate-binding protein
MVYSMCSKQINLFVVLLVVFTSCNSKRNLLPSKTDSVTLKYASGFSIKVVDDIKYITVMYPYPGATEGYEYMLVPEGREIPSHNSKVQVIRTPIKKIICTSTTHIPLLDYLGETQALIGFPTTDYISSEAMRIRIDAGEVTELGVDKGMNLEVLYALNPDLVMGYTMSKDLGQLKKINEMGTPVVVNAEYLEKHPLGRAEWVKFMALFFNKEKEADSIFNKIEEDYLTTTALAATTKQNPSVVSGIVYGDVWFMPGGKNYAARLLKDAGLNYLWSHDESNGFLELSFESVYLKAKNADLWIGVGSYNSLNEMKNAESRYALFDAFTNKKIYTYNKLKGSKGGSEFLELGYLRPDLILKDLVKIGHPHLLPDHELYFHGKLD